MIALKLIRVAKGTDGVFGVLTLDGDPFCVTLEPPDVGAAAVCIPTGYYEISPTISPKHGRTWAVEKVPGRTHILFHSGNLVGHTEGCILLAEHFGKLKGNRAILNSGKTFSEFLGTAEGHYAGSLDVIEIF